MRRTTALLALVLLVTTSACDKELHPTAGGGGNPVVEGAGDARWAAVQTLVSKKEYAAAYAALDALRVPGKSDPELTLRMAEVRRLDGAPDKAIELLREGLAADPAAHKLTVALASLHVRANDQHKAILLLREAVERHPREASLVELLASLYLQAGDATTALQTLERARAEGVATAEVAMLLGQSHARLDQFDAALREFDAALKLGTKENVVLYNKALVFGELKRNGEAVAALEAAVAADPKWPAARRELARAILDGVPRDRAVVNRAMDMLVAVQAELPEDWRLHESIGDAWMLLGDYDAALQAYTEALRFGKNPKSVEDRYRAAAIQKRERDSAAVPPAK